MASVPLARGRRAKQVRSAVRLARDRRPEPRDRDGDPEILSLVEEPYADPGEAHRRLRDLLATFESRADRRAAFLEIYARMTGGVLKRVQDGEFLDPDWVGEYLVAFANLYREAVRDYERGALGSLADPWQLAFESSERGDSLVVQDAALGVNAHINYDLALALEDVGVRSDRRAKYEDHSEITAVIRNTVDEAQGSLVNRGADGLSTLDESLGRFDERFLVLTIDECRDSAWRTAVALHSRFRPRRRWARWINDATATGAAALILSSKTSEQLHETLVNLEGSAEQG